MEDVTPSVLTATAVEATTTSRPRVGLPAVAGHRGASAYLPEHTLAAYRLALDLGADDLEVDVVSTADGVLVARHEQELSRTTDVAERPELAHRRSTRLVDGVPVTGWFVEDLLLDEVRLLRAKERFPDLRPGSALHDGLHPVPTLDEVLALAAHESLVRRRAVGVLVELKDPSHSAARGLPLDEPLLDDLRRHRVDHPASRVRVMSFEPTVLRGLAGRVGVPLVQLVDHLHDRPGDGGPAFAELVTAEGLAGVASYADGLGTRHTLLTRETAGHLAPTGLLAAAHRAGLAVHVWTLRAEDRFLPRPFRSAPVPGSERVRTGDLTGYAALLRDLGADGLITDQPDLVRASLSAPSARAALPR